LSALFAAVALLENGFHASSILVTLLTLETALLSVGRHGHIVLWRVASVDSCGQLGALNWVAGCKAEKPMWPSQYWLLVGSEKNSIAGDWELRVLLGGV
jgi:hypothetical protein